MQRKTSSISASSAFRGLLLTALAVLLVDQATGLFMDRAYVGSTATPVGRILRAEPENLVLGSSTARYAIHPDDFLPDTFNAAQNGQSLFYAAAILRALPARPDLKRVFLGIDPNDLLDGDAAPTLKNIWQISPLARQDPFLRRCLGVTRPANPLEFLSGIYPHRNHLFKIVRQYVTPRPTDGGLYSWYTGNRHALVPGKPDEGPPRPLHPMAREALQRIARDARRLDVELVLFTSPVYGAQRELDSANSALYADMRAILRDTRHTDLTVGEGPEFAAFVQDGANFWDEAHLNLDGARAYSKLLASFYAQRKNQDGTHGRHE